MMKKILILVLAIALKINAQVNLVMNPSFETHSLCPSNTGADVDKAIGWDTCRSTADYFHTCGTNSFSQIPKNYFGKQYPAHGNAYSGFCTFHQSYFYRELIIGQLSSALSVSQKYFISFKVSRADSNFIIGYSSNKMGVKFTKVKQNYVQVNNSAHFYSNNVINDSVNWTKLFGSFLADSAYQYIMIGNFFDDANTTLVNDGNGVAAYYYIDEVCVSTDSAFTKNYVTVGFPELNHNIDNLIFYPNPAHENFTLSNFNNHEIKIFNSYGIIIEPTIEIKSNSYNINCSHWPSGLYFVEVNRKVYKIFIKH